MAKTGPRWKRDLTGSQEAGIQATLKSRRMEVKAVGTFLKVPYIDTCVSASIPPAVKPTVGAEHSLNSSVTNVVFVCFIEGNLWFFSPQETYDVKWMLPSFLCSFGILMRSKPAAESWSLAAL